MKNSLLATINSRNPGYIFYYLHNEIYFLSLMAHIDPGYAVKYINSLKL